MIVSKYFVGSSVATLDEIQGISFGAMLADRKINPITWWRAKGLNVDHLEDGSDVIGFYTGAMVLRLYCVLD